MERAIQKLMNPKSALLTGILLFVSSAFSIHAGDKREATIIDSQHYSNVFGEIRLYRIFLPPAYFDNPQKRYPVIYFFHGWSQRYFGSSNNYADFDKGNDNKGDNIAAFVSTHDVIVVKADGYNRRPDEKYYVRPYNVSPVETHRQFPPYFPELVGHIDTHYHTLADREHRGISGLSMGGFMTFWIAGKYPHLVSGAGNFCGSTEFEVGPIDFPVEYRHIDMVNNYAGLNVRLHYGDKDFIRGYHEDLNRIWPQLIDHYQWKVYDAEHSTCGMGDMFSFLLGTFEHPPARPSRWDHIDVYPAFSVWDYEVSSDRDVPGFTILENVDKRGFRSSVREFLPDGELLSFVNLAVTTSAMYDQNAEYVINDMDTRSLKVAQRTIRSDAQGRLTIFMNGASHEIGINKKADKPNLCIASVEIQNNNWAIHKKEVIISVKLLNKGLSAAKNISAKLSATRNNAIVKQGQSAFGSIAANTMQIGETPFTIQVPADSIEIVKFRLSIQDQNKNEWVDFIEIPVKKDLLEISDFEIADGKIFTVAKGGNDTETLLLGTGNGDGTANPGESIVVLVKVKNEYRRTSLFTSDPYVNPFGIHVRKSDNWGAYDHVGGSAKYDIPLVSSHCPENHVLSFFAEYWLPDNPLHIIKQGVIKIEVKGKDNTSPKISWVRIPGDNIIQVKIYDGAEIQFAKAKLILANDPSKSLEVELKDDGKAGDCAEGDNVFSKKIPEQKFGIYRVVIEAMDAFGNKTIKENPDNFVVY